MRRLPHLVVVLAVALGCVACHGSAHPAPKPRPSRLHVTYIGPVGNLQQPDSGPRHHLLVRCGARNRALCAALVYYATHGPRTCAQGTWTSPAQFGVTGTLRGRTIDEPVAPVCLDSPPMLAAAEKVMYRALSGS